MINQEEVFNLCIDIGNTRIKLGLFSEDNLVDYRRCNKRQLSTHLKQLFEKYQIPSMIVSSTRKGIPRVIRKYGISLSKFIELNQNTPLPISIDYETPATLGKDRVAAAVGADSLYPDERNIVIDAGTCITYDYIDEKSCFRGGNIAPGIHMRLKAMHEFTANLPLPESAIPENILGKSTSEALQNGAIKGTIYEIESFIRLMEKNYGKSRVILTGGDTKYFVDYFNSKIFVVQNLVLIGLNKILQHNA